MVGAIASAIFCGALCGLAPRIAARVMGGRRKAHLAWFRDGAARYARSPDAGSDWAQALPRLIEDGAISREDAALASALSVPGLPDASALLSAAEVDARFALPRPLRKRLALALALAGAVFGAVLPVFGANLEQAALLGAIASTCALMAVVDQRCRIITDGTVGMLCLLGICLRAACGQRAELVPICAAAAIVCICMYAADAVYARLNAGRRAFGDADKKVMAAIVLCSGASGMVAASASLVALLAATLLISKDRAAKRAFGPYAAAAILIGAIASTLM